MKCKNSIDDLSSHKGLYVWPGHNQIIIKYMVLQGHKQILIIICSPIAITVHNYNIYRVYTLYNHKSHHDHIDVCSSRILYSFFIYIHEQTSGPGSIKRFCVTVNPTSNGYRNDVHLMWD